VYEGLIPPDVLFDHGVRVAGGVWVKQPDERLDVLAAGGSGFHFFDQIASRTVIKSRPNIRIYSQSSDLFYN
jgi:hypothetical protein